jgi:hypothetical protein
MIGLLEYNESIAQYNSKARGFGDDIYRDLSNYLCRYLSLADTNIEEE